MQQIIYLIRKEFRQVLRDKAMLRIIFIAPLIQLVLLGYAITTDVKNIPLVICDMDQSYDSRELVRGFEHSGRFILNGIVAERTSIDEFLDSGDAAIVLVIPPYFARDLKNQQSPQVQVLVDGQDSNTSLISMGYANQIIRSFITGRMQEAMLSNPQLAQGIHLVEPEINVWYNPNLVAKNYMVPGIVVLLLTIITSVLTAMGIVREKEIGTLEQLMVTPIKPYQLMIGKTVPFAILGFFEVVFAITVAKLWYHIPIVGNLFELALFTMVFMFTTLGIGIFVSSSAKTQQQAMFMAWFFMVFAIIMSGFMFPIENMPRSLQILTYINPVRYFITIVRELFLKGSGFVHLWQQGVIMLVFSIVVLTLSAIRFEKRIK
ncbi:ABC transporter permease [candidate division KSB1 bacterium]|nr:ABC transporter permease [candidate division KSB1 bacterium]